MSDPAPQTISWNLTRLCNLKCAHCYLDAGVRKGRRGEELDLGQCKAVLEQIHAANPEALLILTGGEPLLRKDLERIVAHASESGLWVVLGTNGTLLGRQRARRLKEAGVKGLGISIDSISAARHDQFRGRPGAWADSVKGLAAAAEAGLDTVLQVSLFPWNVGELPAFVEFAVARGARAVNFYFLVCTGRGQGHTQIDPGEAENVYRNIYDLQSQFRGRVLVNAKCAPQFQRYVYQRDPDSPQLHTFPGGCPAATYYARIDPSGNLTPCPYIPEAGGNLKERPFGEIWNDAPLFRQLRQRSGLQGRCGACEFQALCSGCRARALAERDSLLAEDPFCAYLPGQSGAAPVALPETAYYGESGTPEVCWEPAALETLGKIPPFVRGMVKRRMEAYAAKEGIPSITPAMLLLFKQKAVGRAGKAIVPPSG